jgi:dTDP-4-dehydrorhamnose reductase
MKRTKSVLVVGASGFIGTHLCKRLRENYKVFGTYCLRSFSMPGVSSIPLNIGEREQMKKVILTVQPDIVIYAAGKNDLMYSERNPQEAEALHSSGPVSVATVAEIMKPKFVFLSNTYVFDGRKGNYSEQDIQFPASMLGKSKLAGENLLKGKSMNYVVVRTSPVFGIGHVRNPTFLDQLRTKLEAKERIELPTHEVHSYALVSGLVEMLAKLIESGVRNTAIHYGGLTRVNTYDFAAQFARRFGYDANNISPLEISSREKFGELAVYDYSVNSSNAAKTLKIKPLLLEESFKLLEQEMVGGFGS